MKPMKLTLTGFAGTAKGSGKKSIVVDLSGLTDNDKLIAITGPNGAGKTTVVDNLHPFRIMPSGASSYSPNAFSYYDHMAPHALAASKELLWEHEGQTYKSLVSLTRAGKTLKQEAYLFRRDGAEFVPYTSPDGIVSDGKTNTYDIAVECLLGKPEIFFTAVFSAQGKAPLNTMTAGQIKNLLASMLGVDGIKALGLKAQEVCKALKPALDQIKAANTPNLARIAGEAGVLQAQATAQALLLKTQKDLVLAKLALKTATLKMGEVQSLFDEQAGNVARKQVLQNELDSAKALRDSSVAAMAEKFAATKIALQNRIRSHERSIQTIQASIRIAENQLLEANALVLDKAKFEAAKANLDRLMDKWSSKRSLVETLNLELEPLAKMRASLQEKMNTLQSMKTQGAEFAAQLSQAQHASALATEVPCAGSDLQGRCKLLGDALENRKNEGTYVVQVSNLRSRYATERDHAKGIARIVDSLLLQEVKLKNEQAELDKLQEQRLQLMEVAGKLKLIPAAESQVRVLSQQLSELGAQVSATRLELEHARSELASSTTLEKAEYDKACEQAELDVKRLTSMISRLAPVIDEGQLHASARAMNDCDNRIGDLEIQKSRLEESLSGCVAALNAINEARKAVDRSASHCEKISNEMSSWHLLSTACSNDGIIALSIDDAGPAIALIANQLLEECYGGRFQVRLATQRPTATGVLKEDFQIMVNDAKDGEEVEIGFMSGGEKIWINESLVRAFGLYMARASGIEFKTLFTDEADGPLDPERKRQFMAMKRAVLQIGGYEREFFITHTPELSALADQKIHVLDL